MARQEDLPGTEGPARIEELHALAVELYDLQNERMDLTKREKAKREEVRAALTARGLTEYAADGWELWVENGGPKVKVRHGDGEEDKE